MTPLVTNKNNKSALCTPDGRTLICEAFGRNVHESEINAEIIRRRVNGYDYLIKALKAICYDPVTENGARFIAKETLIRLKEFL